MPRLRAAAYLLLEWTQWALHAISLESKVGLVSVFDGTSTTANEMPWNGVAFSSIFLLTIEAQRNMLNVFALSEFQC